MINIYLQDNLQFLQEKCGKNIKEQDKYKIIYLDPPYNTGNVFNYNDKLKENEWFDFIEKRLELCKSLLAKKGVVIFSISEESLLPTLLLLNKHFKFVYPPFVWQTKSLLNQNKVNSVNSVVHEYMIVASNEKVESYLEKIDDENILSAKIKNYDLKFIFKKYPSLYGSNNKQYLKFKENDFLLIKANENHLINKDVLNTDVEIKKHLLEKFNLDFDFQVFQKRTMQRNHGSERYINDLKQTSFYDEKSLFILTKVKDKNGLNGKCLMKTSYFQSIKTNEIKIKIPSFLGYYQPGIKGFQTAKPIDLMKRIFNVFCDKQDRVLDLFTGSGNVLVAINQLNLIGDGIEIGDNLDTIKVLKDNLTKNKVEFNIFNFDK